MRKYLILTCVCLLFVFDSKAQVEITSAGTSSAYTLNVPGVFPLRNGIQVTFKAHTTCSASATMNVSGTGALAIMKEGNTVPLAGGDIKSGQIVVLAYDGTNWQMLSNIGNSVSVPATYWNLNGSDIYNNNGGNVGIGTPIPTSKLEVQSNASGISDALFLSNTTNADNYGARLAFRSQFITTPWSTAEISGIVSNGITQGSLIFSVMNNRATSSMIEAMRITGNGRVGIGTTNPAENLQISNANNANISLIGSASLSNKLYFGSTAFAYLGAVEYNNNDNSMNFWTNNTPNRIYIDNAGKVGIGNNAPSSALHVTGNARVTGLVGPGTVIADASGNLSVAAGTTITGSGTNNYLARWTPSGSQLGIGATYDDGTNVGVGTSVPAKASGANKYLTVSATDVGTTNASASLEMVGNAAALNTMASRVDFLGVTPVTNAIYTRARVEARTGNGATGHGQLVFYTYNGTLNEAMRIRESGHIGIGGSPGVVGSPLSVGATSQFQINSTGNLTRINDVPYSWPASNTSGFLSNDGSGNLSWSTAGVLAGGTTNYVPKWTAANALSSTSLIFDNGTSVGISTASPSASSKLHIVGAGNGSTLNVEDNTLTNGSVLYLSSTSTTGTASNNSRMITIARSGANASASHTAYGLQSTITNTGTTSTNVAGYFSASGATNNYAVIVPSGGGRVGIGTSSPTHALTLSTNTGGATLQSIASYNTSGFASSLAFQKARGTEAAPTAVASGDGLGYVDFYGYNSVSSSMLMGATVSAEAAQAFNATNASGSNLIFSTAPLNTAGVFERMTVYYNGNVGIGTTAAPTTAMLRVEGNVQIPAGNDYNYLTAKTHSYSISTAAFSSVSSAYSKASTSTSNYAYIDGGTAGLLGYLSAGVNLPDGATITGIEAFVYDNDATYDLTVSLLRTTLSSAGNTTVGTTASTTGASTAVQNVASGVLNSVVDNSLYAYNVTFNSRQLLVQNHRLYGVIITYTVTKAD